MTESDVALAHDVLAARAGGERVAAALSNTFPDAPIHTLLYEPASTFDDFAARQVETSWLNRSSWLRRHYRQTVPVAAATFAARQIDADVTICSSSGLSHHVRTTGAKIVYCHTPARWLHDSNTYLDGYRPLIQTAARVVSPAFRRLDRNAMASADMVIANSRQVATEIGQAYDLAATVVAPCSTFDLEGPVQPLPGVTTGFVLCPARPLGYKRLDVLQDAARLLPDLQFVHIGDGPHRAALVEQAPTNFRSFGGVSEAALRWAYRNAGVAALTCAEDFGLVPLEAAAHGLHTVAPDARGLLDHSAEMLTMYPFGSSSDLAEAIQAAPPSTGERRVDLLGQARFSSQILDIVAALSTR